MKECYIFAAGEYDSYQPCIPDSALIIAADAGYDYCIKNNISPDVIIGDFDSSATVPEGDNVLRLPVEKDVTDTDAAVTFALRKRYDAFHIFGGMGGRPDHAFANYSLMVRLIKQGKSAYLYGSGYSVTAVRNGHIDYSPEERGTVSVFSWTDTCSGVYEEGLKYELNNVSLTSTFALGVSNSFTGRAARISVEDGILLIMKENRS